ncbi:TonB-dependent receptor [uncultured Bacteroides sp.]|uniref:TonB-dependent receptor n=1 Tax=uncultured Bacteroides sp. TaxID=162156 RepID=UPI002631CF59|nr:TonB-dependent receptor [uncultured Bacteroides sp.]
MKKKCIPPLLWSVKTRKTAFPKVPVIMKSLFYAYLLSSAGLAYASNTYSQTTMVSINMKNQTVKEVLNEIENTTEYSFFYNNSHVDLNRKVSVDVSNADILEVLDDMFAGTNVSYTVKDKSIVFSVKEQSPVVSQNEKKITGTIVDPTGLPIIGANVMVKGTTNGTITDMDGKFALNVPAGAVLQISYIGYANQEVKVGNSSNLSITLNEDTQALEEVVVVGYGSMRKKDLTGAVAQVKPADLMKEGITNVQDMLRTGVPGLNVGVSSSAKGGGSLQIRGQRSLTAGNSPLLVVDNVIFNGELSEINPQDIAQIDVLKDASSAAVFGAQSANGVVIITTKKGKEGKPRVNFNANFGIIANDYKRKVYDAEGYLNFRSDWYNSQTGFANPVKYMKPTEENLKKYGVTLDEWRAMSEDKGSDDEIWLSRLGLFDQEKANYLAGRTYDWYDEVYRTGFKQDYTASISGASDKVNYYFSMGYLNSKSQTIGDDYSAIRANMKLEATAADFLTIGANVNFQNRDESGIASSSNLITKNSPFALPYDENGELVRYPMGENPLNTGSNFRFDRQYQSREKGYTVLNSILTAKLKLPFNITYSLNFSPRFQWYHNRYHESSKHPAWASSHNGAVDREQTQWFSWSVNNLINWDYTFLNKHKINVTLGQEAEEYRSWGDVINARDFTPSDDLGFHFTEGANKLKSDFSSNDTHSTAAAYFARGFYSYDDKYMFTYTFRRDGYSAFGTSNPWANFMSGAFAWTFTNEKFFNWEPMNYGKFRASWGSNGNRSVGEYTALSDLTTGTGAYGYIMPDGSIIQISQLYVNRMANPNLKWERTTSWNFGVDFGFFDNRISGSLEYYHMPTTDLVMSQSLSSITGFTNITTNLGEVLNKGFEITLNTVNIQKDNFEWRSSLGISHNKNRIVHLYYTYEDIVDEDGNLIGRKEIDDLKNGWFIGKDINEIWNYQYDGIWQNGEEEEAAKYGQVPGDPKFKDIYDVENHRYSNEDKVFLGSTSPKVCWTFRNDFTLWRNLTASVNIYSKWGQKQSEEFMATGYAYERENTYEWKYWTPENPTNNYARLGATNISGGPRIIDGSFIRLESIALEYSVPKKFLSKFNIGGLRISGSVRNVACWTKEYQCNDPEYGNVVPLTFNFGIGLTL